MGVCMLLLFALPSFGRASPARVVSMHFCTDQLISSLGASAQLISASYLSDDARLGTATFSSPFHFNHANADEVALLHPSLVVTDAYSASNTLQLLNKLHIRTLSLPALQNLDTMMQRITVLGDALGQHDRPTAVVGNLRSAISGLQAAGKQRRTLVLQNGGWMATDDSLAIDLLRHTDLVDVRPVSQRNWQRATAEQVITWQPQIIIVFKSSNAAPGLGQAWLQQDWLQQGPWQLITLTDDGLACGTPEVIRTLEQLNQQLAILPTDSSRSLEHTP